MIMFQWIYLRTFQFACNRTRWSARIDKFNGYSQILYIFDKPYKCIYCINMLCCVWLHMFSSNLVWVRRVHIAKALEMRRTCPRPYVYAGIHGVNMIMHKRQVNILFGRIDYIQRFIYIFFSSHVKRTRWPAPIDKSNGYSVLFCVMLCMVPYVLQYPA